MCHAFSGSHAWPEEGKTVTTFDTCMCAPDSTFAESPLRRLGSSLPDMDYQPWLQGGLCSGLGWAGLPTVLSCHLHMIVTRLHSAGLLLLVPCDSSLVSAAKHCAAHRAGLWWLQRQDWSVMGESRASLCGLARHGGLGGSQTQGLSS